MKAFYLIGVALLMMSCSPKIVSERPYFTPASAKIVDEGAFYDGLSERRLPSILRTYYRDKARIRSITFWLSPDVDADGHCPQRKLMRSSHVGDGFVRVNMMMTDSLPSETINGYVVDGKLVRTLSDVKRLVRLKESQIRGMTFNKETLQIEITTTRYK